MGLGARFFFSLHCSFLYTDVILSQLIDSRSKFLVYASERDISGCKGGFESYNTLSGFSLILDAHIRMVATK